MAEHIITREMLISTLAEVIVERDRYSGALTRLSKELVEVTKQRDAAIDGANANASTAATALELVDQATQQTRWRELVSERNKLHTVTMEQSDEIAMLHGTIRELRNKLQQSDMANAAMHSDLMRTKNERDEARATHKREMDDKDTRWLERLERVSETIDSDRHQQIAALTRELSEARAQLKAATTLLRRAYDTSLDHVNEYIELEITASKSVGS